MSGKGQNTKSIKKKSLPNTRNPVVGTKSIRFYHQASAGEIYIDLTNLQLPAGYTNPSPAEIAKALIKDFETNFSMTSTSKGKLVETASYEIVSNNTIKLKFESEEGEIFACKLHNYTTNGTLIADVRTPNGSGELLEAQREYNLGEAIEIKDLSSQWPLGVFRGPMGTPMLRNDGNAEFNGDHTIGNYHMVDRGDGWCQVIRFNKAGNAGGEIVTHNSHGALGERPELSVLQQVDKIHGIMDKMRQDLLETTGFDVEDPTRYDGGVPTQADIKAFGDEVYQTKQDVKTLESRSWNADDFYEEHVANSVSIYGGTQNYELVRIGKVVTLTARTTSTVANTSGTSTAFIPESMRPTTNSYQYTTNNDRTRNFLILAKTNGEITVTTDNNAGGVASAQIPPFTVSWII